MSAFKDLELSPWYLNTRRLNPMCGNSITASAQTSLSHNSAERAHAMTLASWAANRVIKSDKFPNIASIYDHLSNEEFKLCYIWDVFNFKGVGLAINQGRSSAMINPASFEAKIDFGAGEVLLHGIFSNDHFYSSTCSTLMTGRKRALMIGQAAIDDQGGVQIHPIIVGDMTVDIGGGFTPSWRDSLRVHPEFIESFDKLKTTKRASAKNVREMLQIPEEDIKTAVAEIIGEPFIPKDWGGEKSDLNTNHLIVRGRPASAAFIFKGPSVPGTLYITGMGKRSDQLVRAFDEPVEIIIIQHCNKIDNSVVRMAESFAARPFDPKRYCILDGADTCRLLRAYDKLSDRFSN